MSTILQVENHTINAAEIIPLLDNYLMLPQFIRELIIDRAIAPIKYSEAEFTTAYQDFKQQYRLESVAEINNWLNKMRLTIPQLEARNNEKNKTR